MISYLIKRRAVTLSGLLSFIVGCTVTISFINFDSCNDNFKWSEVHSNQSSVTGNKGFIKSRKFLIILILTSPSNVNRRNAIRQTWLTLSKKYTDVQHFFVIGSASLGKERALLLEKEESDYHDLMVLPDIADIYSGLTRKILKSFVWLDKFENFQYVLKCDDDSFVQVDKIRIELQNIKLDERSLYWGFFNGRAQVKFSGKWKEFDWDLCDYYLPYALGGGYVLSQKLVHFIASNEKFLRLYNSEDVSVGVWLAAVANINRWHDPRFDTEFVSRGCSNSYLVTHKHDEGAMRNMFFTLKVTGKLCVTEYRTRKSYNYNWNVPPSKCCIRNDINIP